jgi:Holliday junction resolvase RusA-like endonuclease
MRITFEVAMEAIPVQTGGKRMFVGKTGKPVFFKDARTTRYLDAIRLFSRQHKPKQPLAGPVGIEVLFVMARPARLQRKKDPSGRLWMDLRPDYDNLVKGLQDALAGFWEDDGQICDARIQKVYAAKGEAPSIQVSIFSIDESLSAPHWGLPPGHGAPVPA